jgi:hypothetical protein
MNRGRVGEEKGGKETDRCPLTRTIPKADDFHIQKPNDFPEVDSSKVVDFPPPPPLVP